MMCASVSATTMGYIKVSSWPFFLPIHCVYELFCVRWMTHPSVHVCSVRRKIVPPRLCMTNYLTARMHYTISLLSHLIHGSGFHLSLSSLSSSPLFPLLLPHSLLLDENRQECGRHIRRIFTIINNNNDGSLPSSTTTTSLQDKRH